MFDQFISRKACNSYILFNENKEAILIDPGYNVNNCLIEHIKKLAVDIKAILLTHGHFDHMAALEDIFEVFPNAVLFLNEDCLDELTNPKLNLTFFEKAWFGKIIDFLPNNYKLLTDYEEFEVCGFKVQMIKTPFHTKGSCCYYVASEKMLFSGDTLFYTTIGRTDLPSGSNKTVESSLKKLIKLTIDTRVYPGHGVATKLEREIKYNSYLRNLSL